MIFFISKAKLRLDNKSIIISIILLAMYFILRYYYNNFTCQEYDYLGFENNPDIIRTLFSFLVFLIFLGLSLIVYRNGEFYYTIYTLILLLFYIPASLVFSGLRLPYELFSLYIILQFLLFFFSFIKFRIRITQINEFQEKRILFSLLLIFGLPFLLNIPNYEMNFNVLIFKDIYETRFNFASNSTPLVNYSYFWLIKILAPVTFIYGLIKRKYLYSILSFLLLTYIYLVSGHKTVYFALALLLVFYALKDTVAEKTQLLLVTIIFSSALLVPLLDNLLGVKTFKFMMFERVFFDQALLTSYYYDFFHSRPIYFSESMFFEKIFDYPYAMPSQNLIAWEYFHSKFQHANTGLIGDAFMNMGVTGVIIISSLFSLVISYFNSLEIDERYFGLFIMYVFDFQNTSFLSILFSGGLFFLMIFALTLMKKPIKNEA